MKHLTPGRWVYHLLTKGCPFSTDVNPSHFLVVRISWRMEDLKRKFCVARTELHSTRPSSSGLMSLCSIFFLRKDSTRGAVVREVRLIPENLPWWNLMNKGNSMRVKHGTKSEIEVHWMNSLPRQASCVDSSGRSWFALWCWTGTLAAHHTLLSASWARQGSRDPCTPAPHAPRWSVWTENLDKQVGSERWVSESNGELMRVVQLLRSKLQNRVLELERELQNQSFRMGRGSGISLYFAHWWGRHGKAFTSIHSQVETRVDRPCLALSNRSPDDALPQKMS